MRFVVTGCGRSGTGYTANLLTSLGLACGHESVFRPRDPRQGPVKWPASLAGDSSWLAAPFLTSLPEGTVVLHQVREPVSLIRSFLRIGFFEKPSGYLQFAEAQLPELAHGDPTERCMKYWLYWNRLAERAAELDRLRYFRIRVEDIDAALVERVLALLEFPCTRERIERALAEQARDYNTRGDRNADAGVTWDTLPRGGLRDALEALASRYGYRSPGVDGTLTVAPLTAG